MNQDEFDAIRRKKPKKEEAVDLSDFRKGNDMTLLIGLDSPTQVVHIYRRKKEIYVTRYQSEGHPKKAKTVWGITQDDLPKMRVAVTSSNYEFCRHLVDNNLRLLFQGHTEEPTVDGSVFLGLIP